MKHFSLAVLLAVAAGSLHAAVATNDVSFAMLKVAPERFRSKLITYTEVYNNFLTTLPDYMEASGFKPARWLLLDIGDPRLPVMIKKKEEIAELVAGLKAGTKVRVSGRVREFKFDSRFAMAPKFYIDADSISVEKEAAAPPADGPPAPQRRAQPRNEPAPPPF